MAYSGLQIDNPNNFGYDKMRLDQGYQYNYE